MSNAASTPAVWPEGDAADDPSAAPHHQRFPMVFHQAANAQQDASSIAAARRALLASVEGELFVVRGQSQLGLLPSSAPGLWLSALRECGDPTCSCFRLQLNHSRRRFVQFVTRQALARFGAAPIQYVSLACGRLLTDAEILSGLIEGGATIASVTLVDSQYGHDVHGYAAVFEQLSRFFAPIPFIAFHSLRIQREHAVPNSAHVLVACDAGEAISKGLRRTASALLTEGGLAATLMNGGRFGSTTRAWVRQASDAATRQQQQQRATLDTDEAATLGLMELDVPRAPIDGPPFPPHMAW